TMGTEVPLTPEGKGIIFRLEFVATGFHVGHGYILTNRHIASEPWAVDLRAQFFISSTGATPRLDKLLAFFPSHRQPITSPSEQHRGLMTLLCARSKPHLQTFRHSLSMNNWEQSRSEGMWS
ncbi:MAG TPA: hypothetical protein VFR80_07550, partial [Pyrinomonadaceae bacterium]|nr:hypothetical protein [Pyrinomonadaceae bacterium]